MAAPVSAGFAAQLTTGYQMVARLEVLNAAGAVILDSAAAGTPLNVVGGAINVDSAASFRRSISDLTVVDPTASLVPVTPTAFFSPASNNELRLHLGMIVNGVAEYVEQGIFGLEGARVSDTAEGLTISLSAYDRARKYSRARRVTPKVFDASASTPIWAAIESLLVDAYPGTVLLHDGSTALTPSQVLDTGGDPWEFARELAESMGYELYFNRAGACILTRVADPNDPTLVPAWSYAEGPGGGLIGVARDQSNDQVFNGQIVTGENPSNGSPVRVVVWDDDPVSPTYYQGPYGKVPDFWQSDKVRSIDQAIDAGRGRLNRTKGLTEAVEFAIVPNPAIEPGDAVRLVRVRSGFPASGPGSDALVVDSYHATLTAEGGAMTVQCRQRRLS